MTEAEQDLAFDILQSIHRGNRSLKGLEEEFRARALFIQVLVALTKREGDYFSGGI